MRKIFHEKNLHHFKGYPGTPPKIKQKKHEFLVLVVLKSYGCPFSTWPSPLGAPGQTIHGGLPPYSSQSDRMDPIHPPMPWTPQEFDQLAAGVAKEGGHQAVDHPQWGKIQGKWAGSGKKLQKMLGNLENSEENAGEYGQM